MPIYIKNKYTKAEDFTVKQGLLDATPIVVKVAENGEVSGDTNIRLGYVGDHNVHIINVDTTDLDWKSLEKDGYGEVDICSHYRPVLIFNRTTESNAFGELPNLCVLEMGWGEGESHVCTSVLVPGQLLLDIASYDIMFALQEVTDDSQGEDFEGNISDEYPTEVFVSDVFKGYVEYSSQNEFSSALFAGYGVENESLGLKKPLVEIEYKAGKLNSTTPIILGTQGDVFVTDIEITLPKEFDAWTYYVLFYQSEEWRYRVTPEFKDGKLRFWVPKEITQKNGAYNIALYFQTNMENGLQQSYSTFINAEVKDSFIENGFDDIQDIALFSVEENILDVPAETVTENTLDLGNYLLNNLYDDSTYVDKIKINDHEFDIVDNTKAIWSVEGQNSIITNYAENTASGNYSSASGFNTIASSAYQTVTGSYNNENEDALFIVGNGEEERSNAFEVLRDGRVRAYGTPIEDNDLTTVEYINETISSLDGKFINADGDTFTGAVYIDPSNGDIPLIIGKNNKVGVRAIDSENKNVGQFSVSNTKQTDYEGHYATLQALGNDNKYYSIRVSKKGPQFRISDNTSGTEHQLATIDLLYDGVSNAADGVDLLQNISEYRFLVVRGYCDTSGNEYGGNGNSSFGTLVNKCFTAILDATVLTNGSSENNWQNTGIGFEYGILQEYDNAWNPGEKQPAAASVKIEFRCAPTGTTHHLWVHGVAIRWDHSTNWVDTYRRRCYIQRVEGVR